VAAEEQREPRPPGRAVEREAWRRADAAGPDQLERDRVLVDEKRAGERLPADDDRAVRAHVRLVGSERVDDRRARHQHEPLDRAVPEELLERGAALPADVADEGDVADLRVVHPRAVRAEERPPRRGRVLGVEDGRHGGEARAGGEREADRGPRGDARPSRGEHHERKGDGRRERDEHRAAPGRAGPLLDPVLGVEERRVHLLLGCGEAGERHDGGDGDEARAEQRVLQPEGPASRGVEAERDRDQRQDVEEVALLRPVGGAEEARLEQQRRGEDDGQRRERELDAAARVRERQRQSEDRSRHEYEAGRVEQDEQVRPRVPGDLDRVDVRLDDAAVEGEHPRGAEHQRDPDRSGHEQERQSLLADGCAKSALA
jgi:hypothetical protein